MNEERLQIMIVNYIKLKYPNIRYCASLGGIRTGFKQAVKGKRTGYVKGFPDIQICEPNKEYHGLFLEIKPEKGYATKDQKQWIEDLNERGYRAVITKGFDNTVREIDKYLKRRK